MPDEVKKYLEIILLWEAFPYVQENGEIITLYRRKDQNASTK